MNIHNQYSSNPNYLSQQSSPIIQKQTIHVNQQQFPSSGSSNMHTHSVLQSSNANTQGGASTASSMPNNSITKDQIKDYLRQWIRVENEIGTLTQEIKKRKLIHQQLSASLMEVMRKNEIDCFDITNGKIVYSKTKTRPPLNKAQLKSALLTYYKDDKDTASSLNEFLIASRVEKVREAIKMKIPK